MWVWQNVFPENPQDEEVDDDEEGVDEEEFFGKSRVQPQESENQPKWIITKTNIPPSCKDHKCLLSDLTEIPRAILDDFVVQFEMDEPGPKLQEKAAREVRETPEVMEKSIPKLQELLREEHQKHGLVTPVDNVAWLKRFLRPTHYYPESAFLKVKNYYAFKTKNNTHKELYNDLKPSKEENLFNHDVMTVLPVRDQEGRRVLVVEIGSKWNYQTCSLDELFKGSVLFLEAAMLEPETQISGAVVIFDMEGLDYWQIWHFAANPFFVLRVVELLQTAAPVRVKGLHIVNETSGFGTLLSLFTKLMQEKFKNRIHLHGMDRSSLHKHIDADRLPPKYGGTCDVPRVSGPTWYKALSMLDEEYEALGSYGYEKDIK